MFVATFADWPPIATDFLGANSASVIHEVIEVFASMYYRLVVSLAVVQIFLVSLLASHPANLALVCVWLLRLSLYGFFHTPMMSKNSYDSNP
jgi:hypothetical protein